MGNETSMSVLVLLRAALLQAIIFALATITRRKLGWWKHAALALLQMLVFPRLGARRLLAAAYPGVSAAAPSRAQRLARCLAAPDQLLAAGCVPAAVLCHRGRRVRVEQVHRGPF